MHHSAIAGGEAEQAGHADVVGIVVGDEFLAAKGVDDGRLEMFGDLQQFGV
jgi:hypothetical protein